MLPVSMNGFGVREATFGFYFTRLGLPLESALLVSFVGAALIMLFSLSGGVAYLAPARRRAPEPPGCGAQPRTRSGRSDQAAAELDARRTDLSNMLCVAPASFH